MVTKRNLYTRVSTTSTHHAYLNITLFNINSVVVVQGINEKITFLETKVDAVCNCCLTRIYYCEKIHMFLINIRQCQFCSGNKSIIIDYLNKLGSN